MVLIKAVINLITWRKILYLDHLVLEISHTTFFLIVITAKVRYSQYLTMFLYALFSLENNGDMQCAGKSQIGFCQSKLI